MHHKTLLARGALTREHTAEHTSIYSVSVHSPFAFLLIRATSNARQIVFLICIHTEYLNIFGKYFEMEGLDLVTP